MRSSTGTEEFPSRTSQRFLPNMSINTFSLMAPMSTNSGGGRSNHLAFVWSFKDTFVFKILIDVRLLLKELSHNLGLAVSISATYTGCTTSLARLSVSDRGKTTRNIF